MAEFEPDFTPDAEFTPDSEPASSIAPNRSWFQRYISDPATAAVKVPFDLAGKLDVSSGIKTPEQAASQADLYSKFVVPQSGTEAGIMAGTLGAGPLVKALGPAVTAGRKLAGPLLRTAGATAGGAAGGAVTGEGVGQGALHGAASAGLGETGSYALGKLLRSIPGAANRIANQDAARIGATVGEMVPPIKQPVRSQADLQKMVVQGKRGLSNMFESELVKAGDLTGPLNVKLLSESPISLKGAHDLLRKVTDPVERQLAKLDIELAVAKADPTGEASKMLGAAINNYRAGKNLLEPLRQKSIWKGSNLNVAKLQDNLASPKVQEKLQARLTPEQLKQYEDAITRGAGVGAMDRMHTFAPMSLRGGASALGLGGLGAMVGGPLGALLAFAPMLTPNVMSQYAGRTPYAVPATGRALADLLGAKAVGAANQ